MPNSKDIYLSVIVPMYNEEKRIGATIKYIHHYLSKQQYGWEILAVDDGCKDKTAAIVKELKLNGVQLLDYSPNRGKGYAVHYGMLHACGEYRIFCDADNATPFEQVEELLQHAEKCSVIIGSRYLKDSKIVIKQPLNRILGARLGNILIQFLILPGIVDTQCGFKLFSAHAAEQIFKRQTIWRWAFDMEILVLAKQLGYKIKQVPVKWIDQAGSTVQGAAFRKTLGELLKIRWDTWTHPASSREV